MHNLRLLRTFLVVLEHGSMIDAAPALQCSPPAVSQQVSRLEKECGLRLFERLPTGLIPTEAGEVLMIHAKHLLRDVEAMDDALKQLADPTYGRLRIVSFSSASAHLMPQVLGEFRENHPSVKISLVDSDWTRPFDVLLDHEADVAIVPEFDFVPLAIPPGIEMRLMGTDPFHLVVARNSPFAKRSTIRFAELADEEFISFTSRFPHTATLRHAATEAGFTPNITSEINDYDVMTAMVAAGLGCAVATSLMLGGAASKEVVVLKLTRPNIKRNVYAACRTGESSVFIETMERSLREHLKRVTKSK